MLFSQDLWYDINFSNYIKLEQKFQTGFLFCLKLGETSEQDSTNFNFAALVGNQVSRIFVGLGGQPKRLTSLEVHIDALKGLSVSDLCQTTEMSDYKNVKIALTRFSDFMNHKEKTEEIEGINYLQYFKVDKC